MNNDAVLRLIPAKRPSPGPPDPPRPPPASRPSTSLHLPTAVQAMQLAKRRVSGRIVPPPPTPLTPEVTTSTPTATLPSRSASSSSAGLAILPALPRPHAIPNATTISSARPGSPRSAEGVAAVAALEKWLGEEMRISEGVGAVLKAPPTWSRWVAKEKELTRPSMLSHYKAKVAGNINSRRTQYNARYAKPHLPKMDFERFSSVGPQATTSEQGTAMTKKKSTTPAVTKTQLAPPSVAPRKPSANSVTAPPATVPVAPPTSSTFLPPPQLPSTANPVHQHIPPRPKPTDTVQNQLISMVASRKPDQIKHFRHLVSPFAVGLDVPETPAAWGGVDEEEEAMEEVVSTIAGEALQPAPPSRLPSVLPPLPGVSKGPPSLGATTSARSSIPAPPQQASVAPPKLPTPLAVPKLADTPPPTKIPALFEVFTILRRSTTAALAREECVNLFSLCLTDPLRTMEEVREIVDKAVRVVEEKLEVDEQAGKEVSEEEWTRRLRIAAELAVRVKEEREKQARLAVESEGERKGTGRDGDDMVAEKGRARSPEENKVGAETSGTELVGALPGASEAPPVEVIDLSLQSSTSPAQAIKQEAKTSPTPPRVHVTLPTGFRSVLFLLRARFAVQSLIRRTERPQDPAALALFLFRRRLASSAGVEGEMAGMLAAVTKVEEALESEKAGKGVSDEERRNTHEEGIKVLLELRKEEAAYTQEHEREREGEQTICKPTTADHAASAALQYSSLIAVARDPDPRTGGTPENEVNLPQELTSTIPVQQQQNTAPSGQVNDAALAQPPSRPPPQTFNGIPPKLAAVYWCLLHPLPTEAVSDPHSVVLHHFRSGLVAAGFDSDTRQQHVLNFMDEHFAKEKSRGGITYEQAMARRQIMQNFVGMLEKYAGGQDQAQTAPPAPGLCEISVDEDPTPRSRLPLRSHLPPAPASQPPRQRFLNSYATSSRNSLSLSQPSSRPVPSASTQSSSVSSLYTLPRSNSDSAISVVAELAATGQVAAQPMSASLAIAHARGEWQDLRFQASDTNRPAASLHSEQRRSSDQGARARQFSADSGSATSSPVVRQNGFMPGLPQAQQQPPSHQQWQYASRAESNSMYQSHRRPSSSAGVPYPTPGPPSPLTSTFTSAFRYKPLNSEQAESTSHPPVAPYEYAFHPSYNGQSAVLSPLAPAIMPPPFSQPSPSRQPAAYYGQQPVYAAQPAGFAVPPPQPQYDLVLRPPVYPPPAPSGFSQTRAPQLFTADVLQQWLDQHDLQLAPKQP
ncbi:hypothetical protein JCM11641_000872 [Rhodosporidiobolus odoratus]